MGLKKVPARLANLILQLAETEGVVTGQGRYRLRTQYTHEELALMVGAKRVAVSRAMKGLREAGRRSIVVFHAGSSPPGMIQEAAPQSTLEK